MFFVCLFLFGAFLLLPLFLNKFALVAFNLSHAVGMLLVVEALKSLHALNTGEVPSVAALVAVFVNLLLFESGVAYFANEHDHLSENKFNLKMQTALKVVSWVKAIDMFQ